MPIDLIDFALAEERESEDLQTYVLSGGQNQLLLTALGLIQQNPDIFIKDYLDFDSDDIDTLIDSALNAIMDTQLSLITPNTRVMLTADNVDNIGGTFAFQFDDAQYHNGFYTLTSVITSWVEWDLVPLKKGTYKAVIFGFRNLNQGIVSLKIGSSSVKTTIDMYNAATLRNQKLTSGTFTIAEDGVYFVRAAMDSKNASSGGYQFAFNWLELVRTGD